MGAGSLAKVTAPKTLVALRAQQAELAERVRQSLPGADAPDYKQELVVNLADGQERLLLKNATKFRKPPINKATFLEFMAAVDFAKLDKVVTADTLEPEEVCTLAKRVLPAILKAMNEWQARHAAHTTQLRLLPTKPARANMHASVSC